MSYLATNKIKVRLIAADNGDVGLHEFNHHASLPPRIFREHNGGMEWCYLPDWQAGGWSNRSFGSVFSMDNFEVVA